MQILFLNYTIQNVKIYISHCKIIFECKTCTMIATLKPIWTILFFGISRIRFLGSKYLNYASR